MGHTRLIAQHEIVVARYRERARRAVSREDWQRLRALERQLRSLEARILERRARIMGELCRKLDHVLRVAHGALPPVDRIVAEDPCPGVAPRKPTGPISH